MLLAREILHENVIRIHDLGEINGIKYISMNYVQGNSLHEILRATGKLTVEKSLDIIRQVDMDEVSFHLKSPVSAALITPVTQNENESFVMLLMPIKLNA